MGFRISTLEDAPGVTWVAGDEQIVFLPGARHYQSPLPLLLVWRRFCAVRLLVCVSCVCLVSLLVYLFPPSSQHGTKTNYPSKFDSLGHWKEVKDRANNLLVEERRKKWQTFAVLNGQPLTWDSLRTALLT